MKKSPFTSSLFAAIFGGLVVLLLGPIFSSAETDTAPAQVQPAFWSPPVQPITPWTASPKAPRPVPEEAHGFRQAAHAALDAVVHVKTQQTVQTDGRWSSFFGQAAPSPSIQYASGSGVILESGGYIITNHHVIDGADAIEIGLNDNRTFPAELIGSDPATDIAVLKIDAPNLTSIPWGNSDGVYVGDWVLAVGNPFDLTSTVTAGIVSAKARNLQLLKPDYFRDVFPVESFIQTDAAVNPGNSGGALVNTSGELVGINTAIASKTGSYTGYSFAVPANLAKKVALDLVEFGQVQRAYLGVNIRPIDETMAAELNLPEVEGVLVTSTIAGSGAKSAGIQPGDVILGVGGSSTSSLPALLERVNQYRPGEQTEVHLWRSGERILLRVQLRDRDGHIALTTRERPDLAWLGAEFQSADGKDQAGAIVSSLSDGALARAHVPLGSRIIRADGQKIDSVNDLFSLLQNAMNAEKKGVLLEGVAPDGEMGFWALSLAS